MGDLKRKAFPVKNKANVVQKKANKSVIVGKDTPVSGRRTSSRLSTATFMTYNEDVIENTVFDKKQDAKKSKDNKNGLPKEDQMHPVSKEEQNKIVNSTKKLTIPLKKLK